MLIFPNAKINLGLHILNKRTDGYHNIETLMLPVELCDVLELIPSEKTTLSTTGISIDVAPEKNLCMKAYQMLAMEYSLPSMDIFLHKVIPSGAGLGGGSADATCMLKALNEYLNLRLSVQKLIQVSSEIGSDCPFFIYNQPCISTGRGELLEPFQIDLSKYHILIIHPGIHINTSWAYSCSVPNSDRPSISSIISTQSPENWKKLIVNDFEKIVFPKYPVIKEIKEKLYSAGAIYSSMTGSGSAVYGIFYEIPKGISLIFDCFTWQGRFKGQ